MKCPACQHQNPPEALFCMKCGTKLERRCPRCNAEYPEEAHFCMKCGEKLEEDTAPLDESEEEADPEAERRQLTVMFCDLVGSTPLSEQLDPEELREVVRAYQEAAGKVIRRFEGHIAQYLGDGLLVYFGYPQAHEDDAARAVRAGLGIVEAIVRLNPRLRGQWHVELAVRVGIHTGLVVAGEMGDDVTHEHLAMGETPNIAARLQGEAEPNGVVVSAVTYRLIEGYFACRSLGTYELRGISQPMDLYQVCQESVARSRLDVVPPTELTPLVGRRQEMELLFERWEQVEEGMGQVVLLGGEAGIGKSRLVQVLKEHVAEKPQGWLTPCQCSAYHQNSAFYPVIDVLERVVLQFERDDEPFERLGKLEGFLAQYGFSLPEVVPLFAHLLSVPLDDRYPLLNLSPERQKQQFFQALVRVLLEISARQPLLLVMEDLHWADPTTLEFLDLLVDQIPTTRILALFTFRPDFDPPWRGRTHLTALTLHRLNQGQVVDMVQHVTKGKAFPPEVIDQIVTRTDGVPLFVEELTKMVLESGLLEEGEERYELSGPLPPLAIPTTLQDSLMARLDRLVSVKEVVQLGATLGREFTYELLQAVSPLDEEVLQQGLRQLVEAELLYQRGVLPQAIYIIKHALIQETAYQSLLMSTRQQYHQRVARVLEERFPETVETQPEQVAYHYTEAGLEEQAIPYWHRAGQRAVERSAHMEAIAHLTRGLEFLSALPDTPERIRQELDLQAALGSALIASHGMAAPEVEKAYTRARKLCQQAGETPQLFPVLWGLTAFYVMRSEFQTAHELSEQLMELAQHEGDPALLLQAHHARGDTSWCLGAFSPAREHYEQGLALHDPEEHSSLAFLYGGEDPGVSCRVHMALALWLLGYPDQALKWTEEGLTLAYELSHPYCVVFALYNAVLFHQFRQEGRAVQEQAQAMVALAIEQGFPDWEAFGPIMRGWAQAEQGQVEEGIAQMRQGMIAWQTTRAGMLRPYLLSLLAEGYGKVGQVEEGLSVLVEALAVVDKTEERWYEAELHRLKGELLEQKAEKESEAEAEACFHQAIEVARRQQAKSLELRATVSSSRLRQRQGRREEARKPLAEIYGWFTEGFDTADLKEAKELLDELW